MSSIDFWVELLDSDRTISRKILKAIAEEVDKKFRNIIGKIRSRLKIETVQYLKTTGTYQSLVYGDLAGHFGLVAGRREYHVGVILETIADSILVECKQVKVRSDHFSGGIDISVLLSDFSDILALPQAVQFSERREPLEWLKWLLLAGDAIIIKNYEIRFYPGEGRSGMAIMVADDAESWRIPPEFAGTLRNNWLTKDIINPLYLSIIQNIVKKEVEST